MNIHVRLLNIPLASLDPLKSKETNQCRFMAADEPGPLYLCCGQETEIGKSYCPEHHALTHSVWERRI